MTEHETHAGGAGDGAANAENPDELRRRIAATREELGATVQALADKADVKARAREMVDERKQQAGHTAGQAVQEVRRRPLPFATLGALLAGLIIGAVLRRKR
jgi:hypothetical protein